MNVYRLHVRTRPDGVVQVRPGWGWRIVFLAITALVAVVLIQERELGGLLPFVGLVTLVAATYQETWTFDRARDLVESRIGVFGIPRVRRHRFCELESIRVRTRAPINPNRDATKSRPGPPAVPLAIQRGFVQLILEFADPEESGRLVPVILQTESVRSQTRVSELAQSLGRAIDVPVSTRFG